MTNNALKSVICTSIDERASSLYDVSHSIWSNPEELFQEHHAHKVLTNFLEAEGFNVERSTPLETSFIARYGNFSSGALKIAFMCEYDALPEIGHGCGHNLIAEVGIAAALGLKHVLSSNSHLKAEIIVLGTPAEEGGFGKVKMMESGVVDDVDICLMSHPTPYEIPEPIWPGASTMKITFHGVATHAAAAPWAGVNALDAAVMCYNSVSLLRQHITPQTSIQCIIVEGGKKINIIPERSKMEIGVRCFTEDEINELVVKLKNCAHGAAQATGCTVEIVDDEYSFSPVKTNKTMIDLYISNAKSIGVQFDDDGMRDKLRGCTDMGNVSQVKPSIHPLFKIKSEGANHTHQFTEASGDVCNQDATLDSAKSLAMTALDVICNEGLLEHIRKDFNDFP